MDDEVVEKAWERYYEFAPLMPDEHAAFMAGARWAREEALREAAEAVDAVEFYFQYYNEQKYLIPTEPFSRSIRALTGGDA